MLLLEGNDNMKKLISVFLSILMFAATMSISAGALTSGSGTGWINDISIVDYDPTNYIEPVKSPNNSYNYNAEKFYASSNADTPYMFYSFLDNNQKAVYDEVKSNPVNSEYEVVFPEPIVFENSSLSMTESAVNECIAACIGGLSAVADDYPMIYWIDGFDMQYAYNYTVSGGKYIITILGIVVLPSYNTSAYSDLNSVQAAYNDMKSVVDSIEIKGNTRYEKLKNIHDFIAERVVYDPYLGGTNENPTDHYPTSVFLAPYTTVCEGYAEAFKILCDKAGIPCIVVVGDANGGGHAWNYVKMEDNKWYAVDLTWDDQGDYGTFYDWFLVGSASTNENFGGDSNTFSQSHTATGQRYISALFSLSYPALNLSSYSRMILNVDSKSTVSKTKMRLFIPGNSTVNSQISAPYGYTVTLNGSKTGSSFTVKNTSNITVETYVVIMWGDVVADALVNASDYNKVKDSSVNKPDSLAEGTDQYTAGDLNSDGVIDAFDTALLDLQMNNK